MPAGKGPEAICKHFAIGLGTDGCVDQSPPDADILTFTSDNVRSNVSQIRLTKLHEMRTRFSEDVLETLSDEEAECY